MDERASRNIASSEFRKVKNMFLYKMERFFPCKVDESYFLFGSNLKPSAHTSAIIGWFDAGFAIQPTVIIVKSKFALHTAIQPKLTVSQFNRHAIHFQFRYGRNTDRVRNVSMQVSQRQTQENSILMLRTLFTFVSCVQNELILERAFVEANIWRLVVML